MAPRLPSSTPRFLTFATPLAHRPRQGDGDYSAFVNRFVRGPRPFRQPLQTAPNPSSFSPGVDVFAAAREGVPRLYALFDGSLSWRPPATAGTGGGLDVSPDAQAFIGDERTRPQLRTIEARPAKIAYDNVDPAAVQVALVTLMREAYVHARANPRREPVWHRVLRTVVYQGQRRLSLKKLLDARWKAEISEEAKSKAVADEIAGLVQEWLSNPSPVLGEGRLDVAAGDCIGAAAPYIAGDVTPDPATTPFKVAAPSEADRARRVTISAEDVAGQRVNPLHYLHLLFHQASADVALPQWRRAVESATHIGPPGQLVHPLLTVFPELAQAPVPPAREQVDGQYRIPVGALATFHVYRFDKGQSANEWRYGPTLAFEARTRRVPPQDLSFPIEPWKRRVDNLWTVHGPAFGEVAEKLQVPAEVLLAIVGKEAAPGDSPSPRAVRLERLKGPSRAKVKVESEDLEAAYDAVAGTGRNDGFSTTVPATWSGSSPVKTGATLTWDQVLTVIKLTGGKLCSPGIMQTLIGTAAEQAEWLTARYPTIYTEMGIPAPPSALSGYLNNPGWLLTAKHSILLGAVKIRRAYNDYPDSTAFDLPLVGIDYNAGSLSRTKGDWGLAVGIPAYVPVAAAHFNAGVAVLDSTPPPAASPRVRFMF